MAVKRTGNRKLSGLTKAIGQQGGSFGHFLELLGKPFLWLGLGLFFFLLYLLPLLFRILLHLPQVLITIATGLVKISSLLIFSLLKLFIFLFSRLLSGFHFLFSRLPQRPRPKPAKPKRAKKKKKVTKPKKRRRWLLALLGLLFLLGLAATSWWLVLKDLPRPDRLVERRQIVSTKIYDRHGQLLYKIYRNQNRTLVKIEDIPPQLIQATVAIEDAEFYQHYGFSLRGILRSFFKNLATGKIQGGSTITQQLVKNALLTPEKTLLRKVRELVLSIQTEMRFNKEDILQMYLNEVGYGGAAYGAEEAAWKYFGKSVRELDLPEATLLAGLPGSPTSYSPFGAHPELSKNRQIQVLQRMASEGFITPDEAEKAKAAELHFAPQETNIKAPHFVMYVKDLLVKKYGEQLIEEGGLEVITTLDLKTQDLAQEVVTSELDSLTQLNVGNAATLITQPQTGEILAMVGSGDYFDLNRDGNVNVTLRPRQPGSAIKPVNYAVALGSGFTPATILSDTPITYKVPGQPPYSPRNYDNRFHGKIPLRTALASSYNVPAVKVLSSYGVDKMIQMGQILGITTWNEPSRFGLALTLGGGEIKMIDLAVAYGTLANLGQKTDLNPILKVTDYQGRVYETHPCQQESQALPQGFSVEAAKKPVCPRQEVLDPKIAYLLTDILSDNQARTPAFGPHSLLSLPDKTVAVKTGTTNSLRDNWTIGYTPELLVATWVGNNDNTPMSYIASGLTGASSIWNRIITNLLINEPDHPFPRPEGIIEVEICSFTGTLPCEGCPSRKEIFISGTEPKTHCRLELEKEEKPEEREKVSSTQTEAKPTKKPKPAVVNYRPPKRGEIIWERIRR